VLSDRLSRNLALKFAHRRTQTAVFPSMNLMLDTAKEFSWHGLEYQYRSRLITDCLRRDIKGVELGY
jgi:hypothetical protein